MRGNDSLLPSIRSSSSINSSNPSNSSNASNSTSFSALDIRVRRKVFYGVGIIVFLIVLIQMWSFFIQNDQKYIISKNGEIHDETLNQEDDDNDENYENEEETITETKTNVEIISSETPGRKKIAFAMIFSSESASWMLDHAAVYSYSVRKIPSKYEIDLVAILSVNISANFANHLRSFGFKVQVRKLPVEYDEIPEGYYKSQVLTNGCCGLGENLKLYAFKMTEYHRVLMMDPDMIQVNPSDELYEMPQHVLYTVGQDGWMGGWVVIKPNLTIYNELVDLLRKGDWRQGTGWEGSGIGWSYGGANVQGILPFYFWKKVDSSFSKEVDGALYDNYGWFKWANASKEEVRWIHYTGSCQKPLRCGVYPQSAEPLCKWATEMWWQLWQEMQIKFNMIGDGSSRKQCPDGNYQPLPLAKYENVIPDMYALPQKYL